MGSAFPRTWRQDAVLVPLARALKLWYRPRVHGLEGVPADRPVVYVAKHPRGYLYLETILLGLVTFWDSGRVPFRPMEKRGTSLHRTPGLSWIRRHVGTIEASEEAALAALAGGESLLVFPGGARELDRRPHRVDDLLDRLPVRGLAQDPARREEEPDGPDAGVDRRPHVVHVAARVGDDPRAEPEPDHPRRVALLRMWQAKRAADYRHPGLHAFTSSFHVTVTSPFETTSFRSKLRAATFVTRLAPVVATGSTAVVRRPRERMNCAFWTGMFDSIVYGIGAAGARTT